MVLRTVFVEGKGRCPCPTSDLSKLQLENIQYYDWVKYFKG